MEGWRLNELGEVIEREIHTHLHDGQTSELVSVLASSKGTKQLFHDFWRCLTINKSQLV